MKRIAATALCALIAFSLCGCASQTDAPKHGASEKREATSSSQKSADADKSDLRKVLNSQGQYQEDDYPQKAWDSYKAALENAYAVNADDGASQDEVDSAERGLSGAERSLLNATSREHPRKFDYDWYKSNRNNRDGEWVAAACMVSRTFQSDGERYLVATIANDDATLSEHDVLLRATDEASLDGIVEGDVLAILGTTDEMLEVTLGRSYQEWLPTINVVQVDVAP